MHDTPPKPDPKNRVTWGPLAAVVGTIFIYFAGQLIGALLAALYPLARGWDSKQVLAWMSDNTVGQFVTILLVESITLGILYLFLKIRKSNFRALGIGRPRSRDVGYALVGYGIYLVAFLVMLGLIQHFVRGFNSNQEQEIGFETVKQPIELVLVFVSLVVLPPIAEEIMTRGFLYSGLRTKLPKYMAVLITSGLFALAHLQFGSGKPLLWVAALDTFILSLVLLFLKERTGRLTAPILLHALKNCMAFAVLFVFK